MLEPILTTQPVAGLAADLAPTVERQEKVPAELGTSSDDRPAIYFG